MSLKHEIKHFLKYIKFTSKNIFKKKVPIYIPVLQSDLLKNRVAIITGATSGIGFSIADSFCKNGCTVIVTGRNQEKLENTVKKLKKDNNKALIYSIVIDINDINSFETKIKELKYIIGNKEIDILVNNAGISSKTNIENSSIEDYDNVMNCNLKGTYFLSKAFIKYMKENKIEGNILNISSSSSSRPAVNPYSLSKWGIKGLTLGLAKKYIDDGITINAIAPGPTATKMMSYNEGEDISRFQYPLNRLITPEEIGNFAVFLVSDMGKMIVGQTIYISGGIGTITIDDIDY